MSSRRGRREEGQASIELIGLTPILLLVALGLAQALMFGHVAVSTEQAARTAARVAMANDNPSAVRAAATEALPPSLRSEATVTFPSGHVRRVSIEVQVPSVVPGLPLPDLAITRSVEMPEVNRWG